MGSHCTATHNGLDLDMFAKPINNTVAMHVDLTGVQKWCLKAQP